MIALSIVPGRSKATHMPPPGPPGKPLTALGLNDGLHWRLNYSLTVVSSGFCKSGNRPVAHVKMGSPRADLAPIPCESVPEYHEPCHPLHGSCPPPRHDLSPLRGLRSLGRRRPDLRIHLDPLPRPLRRP